MNPLTLTPLQGLPIINPGDTITGLIIQALDFTKLALEDNDILVLAQKIVSKSEGRFINLATISPSVQANELAAKTEKDPRLIELVLRESNCVLRTRKDLIIVEHRNGFVCANAGIDHSNVQTLWGKSEDWVLLLPNDADKSATLIRHQLEDHYKARIGVLIIDSHGRAWRLGTVGVAIFYDQLWLLLPTNWLQQLPL
jgi:coenzyme F420-0:L-glutamate ligase/coenzyme F420-1:gamma-L-glutamate ligase